MSQALPEGVQRLQVGGLHNVFALGTNVFSGGTPEREADFEALAKLGVKSILSVDGAKPNVALARKHGLRYVHIPHGYNRVDVYTQRRLMKAAQEIPGPIFVHCHHGKHRGPSAAAVICMGTSGWTPAQGEAWLRTAGTSSNYAGLFETVREFRQPTAEELASIPSDFPEVMQVSGMVELMVQIDERWEHLAAVRKAGYQAPAEHPDIQPANEAVLLWEGFREAQRLAQSDVTHGAKFWEAMRAAEAEGKRAEALLRQFAASPRPEIRARLDGTFDALGRSCVSCHKAHRDRVVR